MRRKISARVDGGTSRHVKRAQTGSKDPHRRERKFMYLFVFIYCTSDWWCHVAPQWHLVAPRWCHLITWPADLTTATRSASNSKSNKLVMSNFSSMESIEIQYIFHNVDIFICVIFKNLICFIYKLESLQIFSKSNHCLIQHNKSREVRQCIVILIVTWGPPLGY